MKTNQATPKTIDEYIAGFPPNIQEILQGIRATVQKAAPKATEAIKYQMPTFVLKGNLAHFAAFKNHIGFYSAIRELLAWIGSRSNPSPHQRRRCLVQRVGRHPTPGTSVFQCQ